MPSDLFKIYEINFRLFEDDALVCQQNQQNLNLHLFDAI